MSDSAKTAALGPPPENDESALSTLTFPPCTAENHTGSGAG